MLYLGSLRSFITTQWPAQSADCVRNIENELSHRHNVSRKGADFRMTARRLKFTSTLFKKNTDHLRAYVDVRSSTSQTFISM